MSYTYEQGRVLHAIEALVASQLNPDARAEVLGFFMGEGPSKLAYVELQWGMRTVYPQKLRHQPGIPLHKLTPDRAWPAAQWIISELRKVRPEFFK